MNSVSTQTEGQSRSPKVLIAEDEVRLMVADALREQGFEVFEAANAPEALAVLGATSGIDVVISDMHMQRKDDGMAPARFLRQNRPDISDPARLRSCRPLNMNERCRTLS